MKKTIILTLLTVSFSMATVIGDFADSIPAGKWVVFPTPTLTADMSSSPPSGTCYAYAQQAVWDSISNKLYFTGAAHGTSLNKAVEYNANTNTWRNALCPREPATNANRTGHTYDHLTIVPDSGIIYFATYNTSTIDKAYFFRYNVATGIWDTTIAPLSPNGTAANPRGNYVYAGAMEYFPDIKSLVLYSHDYGNYNSAILDLQKPRDSLKWTSLGGNASQLGYYHTILDYNPSSRSMLMVSEMGCQIMNAQKQFKRINATPFSGSSYDTKMACEPITNTHIAIDLTGGKNPTVHAYDSDNDRWQKLDGNGENQMARSGLVQCEAVVFKMDEYGIIGLLSGSEPRCLIYKYTTKKDTLPIASLSVTASSTTLEEFMTGQIHVVANYAGGLTDTVTKSCFYRSLDPTFIKVEGCGKVTSVIEGTGRVEVLKRTKRGTIRDTITFTVQQSTAVVDSVRFGSRSFIIGERDSIAITATAYFTRGVEKFTIAIDTNAQFSIGNSEFAVVRGGKVVGLKSGTTYLTASYRSKRDSVPVKINSTPLSKNRTVTSRTTLENSDWGVSKLVDGITTSISGSKGYTSIANSSAASTEWVEIDLASDTGITDVVLFPRTDTKGTGISGCANFPVDYKIEIRTTAGVTTEACNVTNQTNPAFTSVALSFNRIKGRYVRLTATRLGTPATDESSNYRLQLAEMQVYDNGTVSTESRPIFQQKTYLAASPNPFNLQMTVSFALKQNESAVYKIHDASGRVILSKQLKPSQKGTFTWNGRDINGNKLSGGIYFAKLTTNRGEVLTQKLLLMK
ncbi:MAG: discoidin domain-containing protein [Fibrobacteres bacterium]|nr:discoidin domain-containing protein [Fibrobacterota bacterium]